MREKMKILAIGAHPDDIEIGCAGTLIKYAKKGNDIYLLIMTGGEHGGDSGKRRKEQEVSAELMGVRHIFWGGYEDTKLPLDSALISRIEEVMEEVKPDMIFVNYHEDTHQDHRTLNKCTVSACRNMRNLLFFEVPTTVDFHPNIFVDIRSTFSRKTECLEAHDSQVTRTNIRSLSIVDIARSFAIFRGTQARVQLAEGFLPQRLFINIDEEGSVL